MSERVCIARDLDTGNVLLFSSLLPVGFSRNLWMVKNATFEINSVHTSSILLSVMV